MSFVVASCDDLACFCLKTDMLDTVKHVSLCHSRNQLDLCYCDALFLCIIFVSKWTCLMLQNMFFVVVVSLLLLDIVVDCRFVFAC